MQNKEQIEQLKIDFCKHLESPECLGILYLAAKKIKRTYTAVYYWMQEDPEFKTKVLASQAIGDDLANDVTEVSMMKRIQKGSDRLIEFRLLNRKKDKFGKSGKETTNNINNIIGDTKTKEGLSKALSKFVNKHATRLNTTDTGTDTGKA